MSTVPRGVIGSPRDFGSLSSGSNPGGAALSPTEQEATDDVTPRSETSAIVLAAGDGKRLKSALPKVLHRAAGLPLLAHVLGALRPLGLDRTVVVASARQPEIEAELARHDVT